MESLFFSGEINDLYNKGLLELLHKFINESYSGVTDKKKKKIFSDIFLFD